MKGWQGRILDKLAEFRPYVYHKAITTDSLYIRFHNIPHSLRIGGHMGKKKYCYRWNLRFDYKLKQTKVRNNMEMFFYPFEALDEMVEHMRKYYGRVLI